MTRSTAPDLSGATPVMAQFLEMKAAHPDALLFFRMGDFYELFFEDAVEAAEALGIALTKRGLHKGEPIPMCGVPHHQAERYLHDLIRSGFRVAVAEQMEDPAEAKKRGSKSVVKRAVTRIVTAGTLTEDALLERGRHNYLAAYAETRSGGALAWADISTGDLSVEACDRAGLVGLLAQLQPAELGAKGPIERELALLIEETGAAPADLAAATFEPKSAERRVAALFGTADLAAFGDFSAVERAALGALVAYLELTQRGRAPLLRPPVREDAGAGLRIDAATRRNLELTETLAGERQGALLAVIDRCVSAPGSRLMAARLSRPLTDLSAIDARLIMCGFFLAEGAVREKARQTLRAAPDMARALSRLGLERGGPRDLAALRDGLRAAAALQEILSAVDAPEPIIRAAAPLLGFEALAATLRAALSEEPPLRLSDGEAFAVGYDAELDSARGLRDASREVIAGLAADYQESTEISALKIKFNNVLGYFIETPATHASKMLSDRFAEAFIHRQTTANAVRFTTTELADLATRIADAAETAAARERALFAELSAQVIAHAEAIGAAADALAALDVAAALAEVAETERWTRPIVDASSDFRIRDGRHPVVEDALRRAGDGPFVPNACDLSGEEAGGDGRPIWLITGPNMAGKSTFLRQNALMAVLAQMGSFTPAAEAHIGLVDQLFSRVGASDDLARGRSTFMVEMVETAAILNRAGPKALVILDEIGRGTATYDGLSIAWATLEHLHDKNRCRALFATHYHELTALGAKLPGLRNATVAVKEWKGDVVFLREVVAGAADRSYGVQVARLAGMPLAVVARAKEILERLEQGETSAAARAQKLVDDLPLFAAAGPPPTPENPALERLKSLDPDALSPRDALALLYELKDLSQAD